jgi:hypothetical protein
VLRSDGEAARLLDRARDATVDISIRNDVAARTPLRKSWSCCWGVRSNWVALKPRLSTKIVRAAVA